MFLFESLLSLLSFGIVFLEKLAKVNEMNLNLKISFTDILLDSFEGLFLLFKLFLLNLKSLMNLIHFPSLFQQFSSWRDSLKLHMR
jgi:hypothetical protein